MVQTCAEAVKEAVTEIGGTVSTREIINHIYRKHPDRPGKKARSGPMSSGVASITPQAITIRAFHSSYSQWVGVG